MSDAQGHQGQREAAAETPSEGGPPALEARLTVAAGSGARSFTVRSELLLDRGVLVLFGPTGSGKTLTLQALAGLIRPVEGSLRLFGETLFDAPLRVHVPAHRRRIGYVPQHPSLFPFLDVTRNIAFGLPRAERRGSPAVRALLTELGIEHLALARPDALSGGERQRVALARALAVSPRLLLLDEPFASIDRAGRAALRRALRATLALRRIPAVLVTHDPDEALELGDSLVLFERGRSVASGPPGALLPRGRAVEITGHTAGPLTALPDGRASITLREATITAPADALGERSVDADGRLRLDLTAPSPASPAPSDPPSKA